MRQNIASYGGPWLTSAPGLDILLYKIPVEFPDLQTGTMGSVILYCQGMSIKWLVKMSVNCMALWCSD